jgi:hypothetical protein
VARCARIGFIIVGQTKNSLSKKGENGKEKPTDLRGQRRFFVVASPCSLGLSATSQQYLSLTTTNQPPATSQQYSSLRTDQQEG